MEIGEAAGRTDVGFLLQRLETALTSLTSHEDCERFAVQIMELSERLMKRAKELR